MKTIRVRAAVAVNPMTGDWCTVGWDGAPRVEVEDMAKEWVSSEGITLQITHITAEIPIRETSEVEAEVEP